MISTSPRSFKILLAEDDSDDVSTITEVMDSLKQSINLKVATDGKELMDILRSKRRDYSYPDIVLLDLNMPRKSGMEALEEVKSDKQLRKIPVIVLSTTTNKDIIEQAYITGANCYIIKPDNDAEWTYALQEVVNFWGEVVELP